jgi:RNA-directed DNA polymerase
VTGRGVVDNAKRHLGQDHLVALDVSDCFPSTTVRQVRDAFERAGTIPAAAGALTRLATFGGFLPQGPPTSPVVLNLVFMPIDEALIGLALTYGATYTRYMDDLTFSGPEVLTDLLPKATAILKRFGYKVNASKTRSWGPADPHTITKIVLGTTLNPEPEFLADLVTILRKCEAGDTSVSLPEIRGKIDWIRQLNPSLAKPLLRRFAVLGKHRGNNDTRRASALKVASA